MTSVTHSRYYWLWRCIVPLCLLYVLLGIHHGLWTPDEPREAEIAREMWAMPSVIPALDGQPFIEKPPLYYWTVAAAFHLVGHPSADAARTVSALCGALTLLLVYLWGTRAQDERCGLIAALMLASCAQFLHSTHWVLLDPLLMVFTTLALWAAWEVLYAAGGARWRGLFYAGLTLALWTKGLIGPVLVLAGLLAVLLLERPSRWRALAPWSGALLMLGMLALLALAIGWQGGVAALREWIWVNHVQRLVHPQGTGHEQPLPYYLWILPMTVLPWLLPLVRVLRPAFWRGRDPALSLARYAVLGSAAMVVVLSLSATKRETYLLPVLPPLMLGLAVTLAAWWSERETRTLPGAVGASPGWPVHLQLLLLVCYLLAAPIAGAFYRHGVDTVLGIWLALTLLCALWLCRDLWRGRLHAALRAALPAALLAAVAWLILLPHALDSTKNMGAFLRAASALMPAGAPIYALNVDETLKGVAPFETERAVIDWGAQPAASRGQPDWLLLQELDTGRRLQPPANYQLTLRRSFGPARALSLWRRLGGVQPAFSRAPVSQ
ncbi:MAG: glycosyltransferase family 39 protein [Steroidobacteraceae bacterium]